MPLVGPALKQKFKATIFDGLKRVYTNVSATQGYQPVAEEMWEKLADAISDIAIDIVNTIQQDAQVVPGIPVVTNGGPSTQAGQTVAPGKIT